METRKQPIRALFVGRFQPFHLGHLECVKKILSENEEVAIVIGSAQENFTAENPFTVGERMEIIRTALAREGLERNAIIVPVPDTNESAIWAKRVLSYCPKITGPAYSNNAWTTLLLKKEGIEARSLPDYRGINATKVRALMRENRKWEPFIPGEAARFIRENKLDLRVRELAAQKL